MQMSNERINQLKIQIQQLRAKVVETYMDENISYQDTLSVSQELDLLIIEYHRLLAEVNKKQKND